MRRARDVTAVAQSHALTTIDGVPVVWHTMTGGGVSVPWEYRYVDCKPVISSGQPVIEAIELTTTVTLYRDLAWIRELKALAGRGVFTITRQWTDANWDPVGEPEVYPSCLLVGYTNPESAPTSDDALFTVTFATTGEAL